MTKKRGRTAKVICKASKKEMESIFDSIEKENSIKDIISKLVFMNIEVLEEKANWWSSIKERYKIKSNNIFVSVDGSIYEVDDDEDVDKELSGFYFQEADGSCRMKDASDYGDDVDDFDESHLRGII